MNQTLTTWWKKWWVVVFAALVLFTTPEHAAGLRVSPDSVEYAVVAHRLGNGEFPLLPLAGSEYSSRYPVFFSIFMAPLYALFPDSIGSGVFLVWLFSVLSIFFVKKIVEEITQKCYLGDIAAVTLLALGIFRATSHEILADIPFICSILALVWGALNIERRRIVFIVGSLFCFVKEFGVLVPAVIIFLMVAKRACSFISALELSLVPLAMLVTQLLFNWYLFGDLFANGYSYWMHDLYGPSLEMFKLSNVFTNVEKFLYQPDTIIFLFSTLLLVIYKRKNKALLEKESTAIQYITSVSGILAVVLFVHGWFEPRLFLPLYILAPVYLGVGIQSLLPQSLPSLTTSSSLLGSVLLLAVGAYAVNMNSTPSSKVRALRTIAESEHGKSLAVVTTENPLYVDFLLNHFMQTGKSFEVIPFDRNVEYASKKVFESGEYRNVYAWTASDERSFESFIESSTRALIVFCPDNAIAAKAVARCREKFKTGANLIEGVLLLRNNMK